MSKSLAVLGFRVFTMGQTISKYGMEKVRSPEVWIGSGVVSMNSQFKKYIHS